MTDTAFWLFVSGLENLGYKIEGRTTLFGKDYLWVKDLEGKMSLERIPNE